MIRVKSAEDVPWLLHQFVSSYGHARPCSHSGSGSGSGSNPQTLIINERSSSPLNSGCSNIAVQHFPSEGLSPARKSGRSWKVSAAAEDALPLDASPVDGSSPELVSAVDDVVSTIIQVLLFAAFVGLSIVTIGVMYTAVMDFLQKREREREKFEKEEASMVGRSAGQGLAQEGLGRDFIPMNPMIDFLELSTKYACQVIHSFKCWPVK